MICGAESWDDIELFGKSKLVFLRQYLPYESGIPSDDTLRRFFRAIDTTQFQRLIVEWIQAWLSPEVAGKVLAIDGKTLRGSHDGGQSPIHLVSAFASEAGIVLYPQGIKGRLKPVRNPIPSGAQVRSPPFLNYWNAWMYAEPLSPLTRWAAKKPLLRKSSIKAAITCWRSKAIKAAYMMICACILSSPPPRRWPG